MAPRRGLEEALNLWELRDIAHTTLEAGDRDYYEGGAEDEVTLQRNRHAFAQVTLWPRVLRDVQRVDLRTNVLGIALASPVGIAPVAMQKLAHEDGECATAVACARRGSLFCLSQQSTTSVEETCAAAAKAWATSSAAAPGGTSVSPASSSTSPKWFQLYIFKDRKKTFALAERAIRGGCRALVITVDAPVLGRRERDQRNRFTLRKGLALANVGHGSNPNVSSPSSHQGDLQKRIGGRDAGLDWEAITELRDHFTPIPIVLKGVVTYDDAQRAAHSGVGGVWVSNHGGRQLDYGPATLAALPEVVAGLEDYAQRHKEPRLPIMVDGGVRRGTDIVKALAMGANVVFVGRPVVHALAAGGQAGVERMLAILDEELRSAMALVGASCPEALDRYMVQRPGERPPRRPVQPSKL